MVTVSSGYTNYQELLLDLDIVGAILSAKQPTREEMYQMALGEFERLYPTVTVEDKRYELSDTVSRSYHVDYISNMELLANENLILTDKPDDDESSSNVISELDISSLTLPDELSVAIRDSETLTASKRSKLIDAYLDMNFSIEEFRGSVEEVESVFNTVDIDSQSVTMDIEPEESPEIYSIDVQESASDTEDDIYYGYSDEDSEVYAQSADVEVDYNPYDDSEGTDDYSPYSDYTDGYMDEEDSDEGYADEGVRESLSPVLSDTGTVVVEDTGSISSDEVSVVEGTDNVDKSDDFVDSVWDEPERVIEPEVSATSPVRVPKTGIKAEEKAVQEDKKPVPKDLKEFLRLYPHSDISVVLKHFSRNEVKKALLSGKIIRKGSKLHI